MTGPDPAFWETAYQHKHTPWDLGGPTPVFVRLIAEQAVEPGRLLIPGAGRGYDAIAFAKAGFDVTTVDVSPSACAELREAAAAAGVSIRVLEADFFTFVPEAPFDAVLEYTFFCAITPTLRAAYRDRMAALIRPGGLLFGLFFPFNKEDEEGPPFRVKREEIEALFSDAFVLERSELPSDSIKPRAGNERLMLWRRR
ncbi:methyltransferase domain-containing protein [bacterium]|nr:methyltransferase domain-containing protein [bacterium]